MLRTSGKYASAHTRFFLKFSSDGIDALERATLEIAGGRATPKLGGQKIFPWHVGVGAVEKRNAQRFNQLHVREAILAMA